MESVMAFLKNVASIKAIAGMLGVSVLGLLGKLGNIKAAFSACLDARKEAELFYAKYKAFFESAEVKADFNKLYGSIDNATERVADVAQGFNMRKWADKLRGLIK